MAKAAGADPNARHTLCEYVNSGSPYIGLTVLELEKKTNSDIMAIQRNGEIIVPRDETKIFGGDTLISHRRL